MQGALYIGGDNNVNQCTAAFENVVFAEEMHAVHIINADVTCTFKCIFICFICFIFCHFLSHKSSFHFCCWLVVDTVYSQEC